MGRYLLTNLSLWLIAIHTPIYYLSPMIYWSACWQEICSSIPERLCLHAIIRFGFTDFCYYIHKGINHKYLILSACSMATMYTIKSWCLALEMFSLSLCLSMYVCLFVSVSLSLLPSLHPSLPPSLIQPNSWSGHKGEAYCSLYNLIA